jgi:hemerythrin-like metal-binding protein
MSLITWDSSLSVGIASIDAQHQNLVKIINKLHDAMRMGKGKAVLSEILNDLELYTREHFASEEHLLRAYGYIELGDQVRKHKAFVERLKAFQKDAQEGRLSTTLDLMNYLKDWLVNHILRSDKKYSEFLISAGVQ